MPEAPRATGAIPLTPEQVAAHRPLTAPLAALNLPPAEARDWRYLALPPVDQDGRGICVGCATASYMESLTWVQSGRTPPRLSYAGMYELASRYDGRPDHIEDGTTVAAAANALMQVGAPLDRDCPFIPAQVGLGLSSSVRLTPEYRIDGFSVGTGPAALFQALQSGPCVGVFGCNYGWNFPQEGGVVFVPDPADQGIVGYHAVCFYGYEMRDGERTYYAKNSWGTSWGDRGWGYMPESYFAQWGADVTAFTPDISHKLTGDLNMDTLTNAADVVCAMQLITHEAQSTDPIRHLADVNGDGRIDVRDVLAMLKRTVGL